MALASLLVLGLGQIASSPELGLPGHGAAVPEHSLADGRPAFPPWMRYEPLDWRSTAENIRYPFGGISFKSP